MNKYSTDVKNAVLKKILGPEGCPVSEVCSEMGLNVRTVYGWIRAAQNGQMGKKSKGPTITEKFALVMEARGLSGEELGRWMRKKGLREDQLKLWEKEIESQLGKKLEPSRELEQENKELKKEIRRKDKALAEMSALVMLKKKLREMFGDEELPL